MAFEAAVATVEAEGGDTSAFEFLIKVVYNPHLSHYNQHFSPSLTMRGAGYDTNTPRFINASVSQKEAVLLAPVRALLGRLSGLSISQPFTKKIHFVWAHRALNRPKRRFSARAVDREARRLWQRGAQPFPPPASRRSAPGQRGTAVGLYPIVTFQYSSTTLYQVCYHI